MPPKLSITLDDLCIIRSLVEEGRTNTEILRHFSVSRDPPIHMSMSTLARLLRNHDLVEDSSLRCASVAREVSDECVQKIKNCVAENWSQSNITTFVQKRFDSTFTLSALRKVLNSNNIRYTDAVDAGLLAIAMLEDEDFGREGLGSRMVQTEIRVDWGLNVSRKVVMEAQRIISGEDVKARRARRLRRREYTLVGSFHTWHLDG